MRIPRDRVESVRNGPTARFKIEDDVPVPTGRGSPLRAEMRLTMSQMEKSQSTRFEHPDKDSASLQSLIGRIAAKLKPKRFITQQDPDGVGCRVWRIE